MSDKNLKDGGHVYLSCSDCDAGLVDLWITRPDEQDPETEKVIKATAVAHCPFCGDKSFVTEIEGGFHPAPYSDSQDDDAVSPVVIHEIDIGENNHYTFTMKKKKDARPIKILR